MASEIIPSRQAEVATIGGRQLSAEEIRQLREIEAEALARRGLPPRRPQEDTLPTLLPEQTEQKEIIPFAEVDEFLATEAEEAHEAGHVGFMARALVLATLPHSKVKGNEFTRRNGHFSMSMLAPSDVGLPYGTVPRLVMLWITSEAVRTKSPELTLGNSLGSFMRRLGLIPAGEKWGSGGRLGSITRLKDQMRRLLSCTITCRYNDGEQERLKHIVPIEEAMLLWWSPVNPDQKSLWQSTLRLSRAFFEEVTAAPIPVRMSTLGALKSSSLSLDIYTWLTHRNYYAKKESRIPWEGIQGQFGAGYPVSTQGKRDFKKNFILALKKVVAAYPEAEKLRIEPNALIFVPGRPDVSPIVPF